tara:strand:- start:146 stop:478 length:333 start_codon:yes stop_codon:yes gene_type:complete
MHERGAAHMDFNDANILLRDDGGRPSAVLTDFDLCEALSTNSEKRREQILEDIKAFGTMLRLHAKLLQFREKGKVWVSQLFQLGVDLETGKSQPTSMTEVLERLERIIPS